LNIPNSIVSNVTWPALTNPAGSQILGLLFQFEQSQRWPAERLLHPQLNQASRLVQFASEHSPWHRTRLAHAGYKPAEALDIESFRALPLMTRAELQQAGSDAFCAKTPRDHGNVQTGKTTGSTGRSLVYRQTALNQLFWRTFTLRDHFWHGRDLAATLAAIRIGATRTIQPSWGSSPPSLFQTGPCATLDISTDIGAQIDWILENNPAYLLTLPGNLAALLPGLESQRKNLTQLKQFITVGELVSPALRQQCRDRLGISLVDIYSAREVGYMALQCPAHDHYHVQSEGVLLEVLDETGRPCEPGQMGRVVVTALHSFAMPFIRYEIGDYAIAGSPCPCGRGLPTLERIVGRSRNLVTLPDGTRHWPVFGNDRWVGQFPIDQIQLHQRTVNDIEVKLVARRALTETEEKRFFEILHESLGHPFATTVTYLDDIPPGPGGKYEEFISHVTPAAVSENLR
jgi:phenylacetate-CoA ligase